MKKFLFSALVLCASMCSFAQEDQVLMTIAGKPIMVSEFMYIYEKNNQESSVEKKTMQEYLDLFVNFKLKVAEAEAQGVDTTAAFKKELAGYRAQATPKYMKDNAAIDSLVVLSYNRIAKPRRAAHIVVQCPQDADSAAVAAALQRINEARVRVTEGLPKQVKKGRKTITVQEVEDFGDVSAEVSEEPAAKKNRGELGWIQPFRYVYIFEDAVYNTPVGGVTEVFRSPYGFHIAKVQEEGEYEEVQAAHIMKMTPAGNAEKQIEALLVMDSIYQLAIQEGADFAALARANSEDKGSAVRGGDLGWFGRGAMVRPFEDTAFGMEVGQVSKPFPSQYGIHVIKLYGKRGVQPLDSMRTKITKQVERDQRMLIANQSFINKTRVEYGLPETMTDEEVKAYADAHLEEKYVEFGDFRLDLGRNWERFREPEATKEKCFMRKKGYKGRCEKRVLNKCQDVCRTYDDIQRAYADILQEREEIAEFRCNIPLDGLEEGEFTTDFLVTRTDGDFSSGSVFSASSS